MELKLGGFFFFLLEVFVESKKIRETIREQENGEDESAIGRLLITITLV